MEKAFKYRSLWLGALGEFLSEVLKRIDKSVWGYFKGNSSVFSTF